MSSGSEFIGIAGPSGAGKDLVANMICEQFGAQSLSTGDLVRAIARYLYRLPPEEMPPREQLYSVASFLRDEFNPAFTVKVCMEQARRLGIGRAILNGIRVKADAEAIHDAGGVVIAVDADPKTRYARIQERARDSEAQRSYEEFLVQDEVENQGAEGNGICAIMASADLVIKNNSLSIEELRTLVQDKVGALIIGQPGVITENGM